MIRKREGELQTLIFYSFCNLTLILNLEVTIFLILNGLFLICLLDEIIPASIRHSLLSLELEVPTIGPHTWMLSTLHDFLMCCDLYLQLS